VTIPLRTGLPTGALNDRHEKKAARKRQPFFVTSVVFGFSDYLIFSGFRVMLLRKASMWPICDRDFEIKFLVRESLTTSLGLTALYASVDSSTLIRRRVSRSSISTPFWKRREILSAPSILLRFPLIFTIAFLLKTWPP
jgi:hypothetical protein